MLTGHPDARINSNEFGPNPNISVFEWLNTLPDLHGRVSVYATWATFKDIFNVRRSHLPLQVGWDLPYQGALSPRQELLNQLYQTTTRLDDEDVYDAFLQIPLLDSFAKQQPRVLFVGYGETDNWAHAGRYDLVLHSAHLFDQFVEQLWNTLQRLPAYRDQTTFIITTDHGRGSGLGRVEGARRRAERLGEHLDRGARPGYPAARRAQPDRGGSPGADRGDRRGAARQGLPPGRAGRRRAHRRDPGR